MYSNCIYTQQMVNRPCRIVVNGVSDTSAQLAHIFRVYSALPFPGEFCCLRASAVVRAGGPRKTRAQSSGRRRQGGVSISDSQLAGASSFSVLYYLGPRNGLGSGGLRPFRLGGARGPPGAELHPTAVGAAALPCPTTFGLRENRNSCQQRQRYCFTPPSRGLARGPLLTNLHTKGGSGGAQPP